MSIQVCYTPNVLKNHVRTTVLGAIIYSTRHHIITCRPNLILFELIWLGPSDECFPHQQQRGQHVPFVNHDNFIISVVMRSNHCCAMLWWTVASAAAKCDVRCRILWENFNIAVGCQFGGAKWISLTQIQFVSFPSTCKRKTGTMMLSP